VAYLLPLDCFERSKRLDLTAKFFPRVTKNRLADPSGVSAFDFKREFLQFALSSGSATIGIDRAISIFGVALPATNERSAQKAVTPLSRSMSIQQRSAIAKRRNDGRLRWWNNL